MNIKNNKKMYLTNQSLRKLSKNIKIDSLIFYYMHKNLDNIVSAEIRNISTIIRREFWQKSNGTSHHIVQWNTNKLKLKNELVITHSMYIYNQSLVHIKLNTIIKYHCHITTQNFTKINFSHKHSHNYTLINNKQHWGHN